MERFISLLAGHWNTAMGGFPEYIWAGGSQKNSDGELTTTKAHSTPGGLDS